VSREQWGDCGGFVVDVADHNCKESGNIPIIRATAESRVTDRVSTVVIFRGKWSCLLLGARTEWWKRGRWGSGKKVQRE